MTDTRKRNLAALIVSISISSLGGCSTTQVDIGYRSSDLVAPVADEAVTFKLGQFVDRRGEAPDWLGEVRGKYYFPKETLKADRPVSWIVRDVFEKGAKDRGMLGETNVSTPYELYGHVEKLDGSVSDSTIAHAHLMVRLFNRDGSDDIFSASHHIDIVDPKIYGSAIDLGSFLEEALNQAVVETLDDPDFRQVLQRRDADGV